MEHFEKQEIVPKKMLDNLLKNLLEDKSFGKGGRDPLYNNEWNSLKTKKESLSDERPDYLFLVEPESLKSVAGFFSKDVIYPFHETTRTLLEKYAEGGRDSLNEEELDWIKKQVHLAANYLGEKDRTRGVLLDHLEIGLTQ